MKKILSLLILVLISSLSIFGQNKANADLVTYSWRYSSSYPFGTILVPKGFSESTNNYREGIITHLTYPDGAVIVLHRGGMMKLPFFEGENYLLAERCEKWGGILADDDIVRQVFRRGKVKDKDLFWREENTFIKGFPLSVNIGYDKVPKEREKLFDEALDSYKNASRKTS